MLESSRTCSPAYFILNARNRNVVIEKDRKGVKAIYENNQFIVQTNSDREKPDPDSRRTTA
jgi:hypothetical protein